VVLDGVSLPNFETCPAWVGNEDERDRYVLRALTAGKFKEPLELVEFFVAE